MAQQRDNATVRGFSPDSGDMTTWGGRLQPRLLFIYLFIYLLRPKAAQHNTSHLQRQKKHTHTPI